MTATRLGDGDANDFFSFITLHHLCLSSCSTALELLGGGYVDGSSSVVAWRRGNLSRDEERGDNAVLPLFWLSFANTKSLSPLFGLMMVAAAPSPAGAIPFSSSSPSLCSLHSLFLSLFLPSVCVTWG
ncbi:uncharacterized protein DS421_2g44320 [Arachis hypogaea]|nr:uncharacterized protein DS421_2g44320 [Arachis hypogaea]